MSELNEAGASPGAAQPSMRFLPPAAPLRRYLTAYYVFEVPAGTPPFESPLHPEWPNIRFPLPGGWTSVLGDQELSDIPALYGPTTRGLRLRCRPPAKGFGIGLLPLGWAHLIGLPASQFVDRVVPLNEVFGTAADTLHEAMLAAADEVEIVRLVDAFLLERHERRPEPPEIMTRAHAVLLDPSVTTTEVFAERLGVTTRHLARMTGELFGFTPKMLLRRQRFLRTLAMLEGLGQGDAWSRHLDPGYFDQSHFVRDFHVFMGVSPTEYYSSPRLLLEVAQRARMAALGAPTQLLHRPSEAPA